MDAKKQLGTLLVEKEIISKTTLVRALERQKGSGKRLGVVLEEMGVITEEELADGLAKQFGFKTAKGFAGHSFPHDILKLVHEDMAVQKQIFPLKIHDGMLAIAVTDPFDLETFDFLHKKCGLKMFPVVSTRKEIMAAIKNHYLGGNIVESDARKILVVDDSSTVTTIISAALRKEGYVVVEAKDGVEGFKQAIAEKPDLIVCDSIMPKMDGYAMFRSIKENPSTASIPAILLTSKASSEDEQRAFEAGFLDFVPKPVQPIRIVTRVKRAFVLLEAMKR